MPKPEYRALVLDLDGTLVSTEDVVAPGLADRLRALDDSGVRVMIATGRSETGVQDLITSLGILNPATIYNGAGLWDPKEERMLEERVISGRTARRVLDIAARTGDLPVVMRTGEKVGRPPRTEAEREAFLGLSALGLSEGAELPHEYLLRITLFTERHESSAAFAAEFEEELTLPVYITHFPLRALAHYPTSPLLVLDVQPPCAGKAEAIRYLGESEGIAPEEVVAVGDATNDLPMFEAAGLAVAVENAMPEALAAADRVIGPCGSGGLSDLIDELFPSVVRLLG